MFKIYSIMAAAALIAGALVVAPSLREVSASTAHRHHPDHRRQGRPPRHGGPSRLPPAVLALSRPFLRARRAHQVRLGPEGAGGIRGPQVTEFERRKPFTSRGVMPTPLI